MLTLLLVSLGLLTLGKDASGTFFIENAGQWAEPFQYKAHVTNGAMFFTPNSIVYNFYDGMRVGAIHEEHHEHNHNHTADDMVPFHAFKMEFVNANPNTLISASDKKSYYQNYYLGADKNKWRSQVATYETIKYNNLYPDIDLAYLTNNGGLKYEFYVAPNANTEQIAMTLSGASARLHTNGNLIIETSVGEKSELKPISYQIINGKRRAVATEFVLKNNVVSFSFPDGYNHAQQLIIDPVLIFATYSGGTSTTFGWSAAYDNTGHLFAGGECFGVGWPVTLGSYQQAFGGSIDVGINRYTPTGTGLMHSSYLGGNGGDFPSSMVCTSNDELIIAGYTASSNFPTSTGCYDNTLGGSQDLFITSMNLAGTALLGSTYLGGSGTEGSSTQEVNVDANNNIYLGSVTSSTNFPTTTGAYQAASSGGTDGVVVKMNLTCTTLLASTYLGGTVADACESIHVAANGDIITSGRTASSNFPTSAGAFQTVYLGGPADGFVTKFNSSLTTMIASTFLGTTGDDNAYRVQMDLNNNIYVCGTASNSNYPASPGVYSNANGRIFMDKLNPTLTASLISTRLGATTGSSSLKPTAFLLDVCDNVYVSSQYASGGLPLSADAIQTTQGGLWVTVLTPNYGSLLYASYMGSSGDHIDGGGSRFDPNGIIYQSICTNSSNFYNTPGAHSPSNQSSWDIASMKLEFGFSSVVAGFTTDKADTVCVNELINFTSTATSATIYNWDFGNGDTSTLQNPVYSFAVPGVYIVTLIAENAQASCASSDTVIHTIHVAEIIVPTIFGNNDTTCNDDPFALQLDVTNDDGHFNYSWSPAAGIVSGGNTANPIINPTAVAQFTARVIHYEYAGYCADTSSATINITKGDTTKMAAYPSDTTICYGDEITMFAVGGDDYLWTSEGGITNPTSPFINDKLYNEKKYAVTIQDRFGCMATKYCYVKTERAEANAGDDQIIRFGESIVIGGWNNPLLNYAWANDPSLSQLNIYNPEASPIQETEYTLVVSTQLGCKDTDMVVVQVSNFSLPNAFSPNGDNKNDVFKVIIPNNLVQLKSLKIFNRWGQNIFYTTDANQGWDGTIIGERCEIGTYFYHLELTIGHQSYKHRGDITLIR